MADLDQGTLQLTFKIESWDHVFFVSSLTLNIGHFRLYGAGKATEVGQNYVELVCSEMMNTHN